MLAPRSRSLSLWRTWRLGAAAGLAALLLAAPPAAAQQTASPKPASPQPAAADLAPGLAVLYYYAMVRHIDELVEWMGYREGRIGDPLPSLDYRTGEGPVLTSKSVDGVGAKITGFIHLETPGSYSFAVRSNDGVRLDLGGATIIEDPDVHSDRFSLPADIEVTEPGWYPLEILYFERKNTSTLQLFWYRPGDDRSQKMQLVPAEVFAHSKS